MRTLATLAALALAGPVGAQNQQAGKLPTNDQTAFVASITMEVTATGGEADTLDPSDPYTLPKTKVPQAQHADTAGSAGNVSPPGSCYRTQGAWTWEWQLDPQTGELVCVRTGGP